MADERERPCAAPVLPPALDTALEGYRWARDTVGGSGAAVYRLHGAADRPDLYLKHGAGAFAAPVTGEMVRLRWLDAYLPVPHLHHFALASGEALLLTQAVDGRTAYQMLDSDAVPAETVVDALALFLRRLHAIPPERCPFVSDHRLRLASARDRMEAGSVETDDFDEEREGWTAEQVWDEMTALLPIAPDPVVTHGDFSLDNVLLDGGVAIGCIDLDRVGIADRWQDLAIAWSCLGEFHAALQDRFLQSYGVTMDTRKLRFHLMLDEFF